MPYLIRLVDDLTHTFDEPTWLRSLDVDAHDGRGDVRITHDPTKAMRFASIMSASQCWQRQSTVRPLRPDGKPNRPLTAYTITFDQVPEEGVPDAQR